MYLSLRYLHFELCMHELHRQLRICQRNLDMPRLHFRFLLGYHSHASIMQDLHITLL